MFKQRLKMKKGDCFLMKGSTINEPMTLYYITDERGDKIRALSICIDVHMVQGLDWDNEYDNDIPAEAVVLPSDTYSRVKESMKMFVKETKKYIEENIGQGNIELQVGRHYYSRYIRTITEMGETKVKYNLFRLEKENISPCWTGEGDIDTFSECCLPISETVYQDVILRYNEFVQSIRKQIWIP